MKPLDKKQIPQVIVLAVLAVVFFGYFAMKMILPTPAAARSQSALPPAAAKPEVKASGAAVDAAAFTAPLPGTAMHDPFVPSVSDQPAHAAPAAPVSLPKPARPAARIEGLKVASIAPLAIPSVPELPSATIREQKSAVLGRVPSAVLPLPAVPIVPNWTVTGVLQSGAEHVAILRSGSARLFVKRGDYVDSEFVVAAVTRDSVTLRHGQSRFMLPLGGSKAAPAGAASRAAVPNSEPQTPGPDIDPQKAVPDSTPQTAAPAPVIPDVAFLPTPRVAHHAVQALARRVAYRVVKPKVRVADYRCEKALPLFPGDATSGLLPSGAEAPDFSLSAAGGDRTSLSQFRGRVVVLDFWASWDAPSVRSLAALERLQKDSASQNLAVIAVNSWDNKSAMLTVLQSCGEGAMQLYDPSVSNASVAVSLYRAPDVPTFYVIDQKGRVAGAFVGYGRNTTSRIKATLAKLGVVSTGTSL